MGGKSLSLIMPLLALLLHEARPLSAGEGEFVISYVNGSCEQGWDLSTLNEYSMLLGADTNIQQILTLSTGELSELLPGQLLRLLESRLLEEQLFRDVQPILACSSNIGTKTSYLKYYERGATRSKLAKWDGTSMTNILEHSIVSCIDYFSETGDTFISKTVPSLWVETFGSNLALRIMEEDYTFYYNLRAIRFRSDKSLKELEDRLRIHSRYNVCYVRETCKKLGIQWRERNKVKIKELISHGPSGR